MEKKKYRRLTYQERIIIETLLNQGKTKANIAEKIKRTRSTISREVNKWGDKPGSYDGSLAHWCAANRLELDIAGLFLAGCIHLDNVALWSAFPPDL